MASQRTRQRAAPKPAVAPTPAAMTRVQIAITGVVERYDAAGKMVESKALAEHPIGLAAMSAAALSEDLAGLTGQLAALWPAVDDEPEPVKADPEPGA